MHPDSLLAVVSPDSATVAGWIAAAARRWFPSLPDPILLAFLGGLTALALDLFERLVLKAADWLKGVPIAGSVFGIIRAIWQAEWQTRGGQVVAMRAVVNPVLALVAGGVGAGNPLVGIVAAGVRSMGTKPVTEWAMKRLRLGVLIAGLGLMLASSPASAQAPADSAIAGRRLVPEWCALSLGTGVALDWTGSVPSDPKPRPWIGGRAAAIVGSNVSAVATLRRGLTAKGEPPWWGAEVGVWVHY